MLYVGQLLVSIADRDIRSNGKSLRIGSRAFDILQVLIEANGATVSKAEIMRRVWPNSVVEENNLHVHVAALRKVLAGDRDLIRTVPGRGYRLISGTCSAPAKGGAGELTLRSKSQAPARLEKIFGREGAIAEIIGALRAAKTVTLVGAGGIGKTCIATDVASRVGARFPDGVIFVSLDSVSEPRLALNALANSLSMPARAGRTSVADIADGLTGRSMLLVLDNCEHVIDVAAEMASFARAASPEITVLATSREALRVPGELVYYVQPLDVPDEDGSRDEILGASAVQLFTTRACAADPRFSLNERSVRQIGSVCRRLDGIPLAIELAAARAAVLGLEVLTEHLDDHFRMLTGGLRTALPRHQTLKATLDWSNRLLMEPERKLLRRLGIFTGGFSLDAVHYVVNKIGLSQAQVLDALGSLVAKSLVVRVCTGASPRYRLLAITRAYALQQLEDFGEHRVAALSHALYLQWFFSRTPSLPPFARPLRAALAEFQLELGNLRAALDWAFSPDGDRALGVTLSAVALPHLFNMSLVDECSERARVALDALLEPDIDAVSSRTRLLIQAIYAATRVFAAGPDEAAYDTWRLILSQAWMEQDPVFQLFALWGLWIVSHYRGEARIALRHARRFCTLAEAIDNPDFRNVGSGMVAVALHYIGQPDAAKKQFEEILHGYKYRAEPCLLAESGFDHSVAARASLARVMWAQGEHESALQLAQRALNEALNCEHDILICEVLAEGLVPIALLTCSFDVAQRGIALLEDCARRSGLVIWLACSDAYKEYLDSAMHPDALRLPGFRCAIETLRQTGYLVPLTMLLAQYARCLNGYGRTSEATEVLADAQRRCEVTGERWFYPQLVKLTIEFEKVCDNSSVELHGIASMSSRKLSRLNSRSRRGYNASPRPSKRQSRVP
jgi:predicted ATPase/DNA-binding winged helix-turn-helix (wHTH) protein